MERNDNKVINASEAYKLNTLDLKTNVTSDEISIDGNSETSFDSGLPTPDSFDSSKDISFNFYYEEVTPTKVNDILDKKSINAETPRHDFQRCLNKSNESFQRSSTLKMKKAEARRSFLLNGSIDNVVKKLDNGNLKTSLLRRSSLQPCSKNKFSESSLKESEFNNDSHAKINNSEFIPRLRKHSSSTPNLVINADENINKTTSVDKENDANSSNSLEMRKEKAEVLQPLYKNNQISIEIVKKEEELCKNDDKHKDIGTKSTLVGVSIEEISKLDENFQIEELSKDVPSNSNLAKVEQKRSMLEKHSVLILETSEYTNINEIVPRTPQKDSLGSCHADASSKNNNKTSQENNKSKLYSNKSEKTTSKLKRPTDLSFHVLPNKPNLISPTILSTLPRQFNQASYVLPTKSNLKANMSLQKSTVHVPQIERISQNSLNMLSQENTSLYSIAQQKRSLQKIESLLGVPVVDEKDKKSLKKLESLLGLNVRRKENSKKKLEPKIKKEKISFFNEKIKELKRKRSQKKNEISTPEFITKGEIIQQIRTPTNESSPLINASNYNTNNILINRFSAIQGNSTLDRKNKINSFRSTKVDSQDVEQVKNQNEQKLKELELIESSNENQKFISNELFIMCKPKTGSGYKTNQNQIEFRNKKHNPSLLSESQKYIDENNDLINKKLGNEIKSITYEHNVLSGNPNNIFNEIEKTTSLLLEDLLNSSCSSNEIHDLEREELLHQYFLENVKLEETLVRIELFNYYIDELSNAIESFSHYSEETEEMMTNIDISENKLLEIDILKAYDFLNTIRELNKKQNAEILSNLEFISKLELRANTKRAGMKNIQNGLWRTNSFKAPRSLLKNTKKKQALVTIKNSSFV